jgi:hypothetical protein
MSNALLVGEGAALRVEGAAEGPEPVVSLTLRLTTARMRDGLVRVSGGGVRPVLPRVDVVARDAIVATDEGRSPLVEVDGAGDLASLRDVVRWDGNGVAYHRVETYRRDRGALETGPPLDLNQFAWQVQVGDEEGAFHGDARFRGGPPGAEGPAWEATVEGSRLAADSPVPMAGPRLDQLPRP